MKKFKQFIFLGAVFVAVFLLGACDTKDDDTFNVYGDVVFMKKKIDDQVVNAVAYYAYANRSIASATVTLPNSGGTVELAPFGSSTYTYLVEPANSDYSTEMPVEGNYLFSITDSKGENIEVSDEQESDNLSFITLDSLDFNESNVWLYLEWNEVSGADSYVVKLLDSSGNVVFNGYSSDADVPEYYVSYYYTTGVWSSAPVKGQTYTLSIQCNKYDADATDEDYVYNIQEVSVYEQQIVWQLD